MAFEIDTHDDEFVMDDDFEDQTKIMVIGVGGGGGNAVSHMVEGDMTGIDYVVANAPYPDRQEAHQRSGRGQ